MNIKFEYIARGKGKTFKCFSEILIKILNDESCLYVSQYMNNKYHYLKNFNINKKMLSFSTYTALIHNLRGRELPNNIYFDDFYLYAQNLNILENLVCMENPNHNTNVYIYSSLVCMENPNII